MGWHNKLDAHDAPTFVLDGQLTKGSCRYAQVYLHKDGYRIITEKILFIVITMKKGRTLRSVPDGVMA